MNDLDQQIAALRTRAQAFREAMSELASLRIAVRQDRRAAERWRELVTNGNAIRAAVETATKMLDGGRKWAARYLHTDALETVPFAANVVSATARGAAGAIDEWLDRAKIELPQFRALAKSLGELPESERKTLEQQQDASGARQSIVPALLLIGALGALAYFGGSFTDDDY